MLTGQHGTRIFCGASYNEFADPASEDILGPSLGQFPIQLRLLTDGRALYPSGVRVSVDSTSRLISLTSPEFAS